MQNSGCTRFRQPLTPPPRLELVPPGALLEGVFRRSFRATDETEGAWPAWDWNPAALRSAQADREDDPVQRTRSPSEVLSVASATQIRRNEVKLPYDDLETPEGAIRYATSAARIAANGRNALRSTGPRTDAGKAASSANATQHGVWAKGLEPIRSGPFAEDATEVVSFVDEFVADLAPRGRAAEAQAREIAGLCWKRMRLDRFEASAVGRDSAPGFKELSSVTYYERIEDTATMARVFRRWAEGDEVHGAIDELVRFVADIVLTDNGKVRVEGVWDETHEPATEDGWLRVLEAIVVACWPGGHGEALAWARSLEAEAQERLTIFNDEVAENSADRILSNSFDKTTRIRVHLSKQIEVALRQFELLQNMHRNSERPAGNDSRETNPTEL